jgi:UDP-glucose 4-epimerase
MSVQRSLADMPVAVVGAGGFIAGRLIGDLERAGATVAAYTRNHPFCGGDGLPDIGLRRARIVYHLATSINIGLADQFPNRVDDDHRLFRQLLHALRSCWHRPVLVLASSGGAVYDPAVAPPYREGAPLRPVTAYGRAKVELEQRLLRDRDRLVPVIVRLSNPYGPGQPLIAGQGVLRHWLGAVVDGRPIKVFGNPDAIRDYVYIADVTDALVRVAQCVDDRHPGLTLNIGSGQPTSLTQLIEAVRRGVGRPVAVEMVGDRTYDRRDIWLDVSAAATALDWRPRTALVPGIERMWQDMRALVP